MSVYPNIGQSASSTETRLTGKEVDRATNGSIRGRSYYTADKKIFSVIHAAITTTQKNTIETFYTNNKDITFDFLWKLDDVTYTCIFSDTPMNFEIIGSGFWNAEVALLEA